jgi:uncharacterized membrane protein YagU involved in acid resistance
MKEEELTPEEFAEQVKEQLKTYVELRTDLFKARFTEKISIVAGKLFAGIILLFVFAFAVLFVSLVAGFYFTKLFDSMFAGFGVVAGFYVFLFILILIFKKQLVETPVANQIISIVYESDEA